ncbi:hypothetical protein FQK00_17415 [Xanthomonas vasicola]|nr:hypothetical protein FQK00_17415 [Xanthomonas vasicola]
MQSTASQALRRPPLDVQECRVMVAIRVFDKTARNLMRYADADCVALTLVGEITDSTHRRYAEHKRIALIALDFFRRHYAAA